MTILRASGGAPASYECNNDAPESAKNGHDQPGHGSAWKDFGTCDKTPS
ncbi:MAG TPA: hypothetical protein VH143_12225 [Kofleriaceae bacterium]|nr:hypothetical protein [Kofleriaceae bacterium]